MAMEKMGTIITDSYSYTAKDLVSVTNVTFNGEEVRIFVSADFASCRVNLPVEEALKMCAYIKDQIDQHNETEE